MGDMSEYMIERQFDEMWEDRFTNRLGISVDFSKEYCKEIADKYSKGILKWTTKDDRMILIGDMTIGHLWNTVNWLDRNNTEKKITVNKWIELFMLEIESRD